MPVSVHALKVAAPATGTTKKPQPSMLNTNLSKLRKTAWILAKGTLNRLALKTKRNQADFVG